MSRAFNGCKSGRPNKPVKRSATEIGPASPFDDRSAHSIERKGDDVVATVKVDLGVASRADHDVLLAPHHVGGGRCIDPRPGPNAPQSLPTGRLKAPTLAL